MPASWSISPSTSPAPAINLRSFGAFAGTSTDEEDSGSSPLAEDFPLLAESPPFEELLDVSFFALLEESSLSESFAEDDDLLEPFPEEDDLSDSFFSGISNAIYHKSGMPLSETTTT